MVVTITSSLHGQRVERANRLAVGLSGIAARGDAVGTGAGLGASIHWYPSRQPWLSLVLRATASSFGDVKLTQRPWGVGATETVADYTLHSVLYSAAVGPEFVLRSRRLELYSRLLVGIVNTMTTGEARALASLYAELPGNIYDFPFPIRRRSSAGGTLSLSAGTRVPVARRVHLHLDLGRTIAPPVSITLGTAPRTFEYRQSPGVWALEAGAGFSRQSPQPSGPAQHVHVHSSMTNRRDFLRRAAVATSASAVSLTMRPGLVPPPEILELASANRALPTPPAGSPATVAEDEAYWREVAAQYAVTDKVTNLEAGYWGMMANPVLAAYHRHVDRVNRENSWFARREFPALSQAARQRVAAALGVDAGEIAFARNATEALQHIIGQYNRLQAGDTVIYADLDYPAMQMAMNALAARRGATVVTIAIPEPASRQSIIDVYSKALEANPRTRLLLLTHPNNKSGLMLPVREIADMARARGVDAVIDTAHAFGQFPLSLPDLGVPFAGVNLHKWMGAPLGVAALYISKDALDRIDRAHGDDGPLDRIDSRIHTGTTDFAAIMTVPDAMDFQDRIGIPRKAARLALPA